MNLRLTLKHESHGGTGFPACARTPRADVPNFLEELCKTGLLPGPGRPAAGRGSLKMLALPGRASNNFGQEGHIGLRPFLLGDRPTAGLRALDPPMEVRILLPQPFSSLPV